MIGAVNSSPLSPAVVDRLLDLTSDAVFVEVDGTIVTANEAAAKLYDCASPDDLIGRDSSTMVPAEWGELLSTRPERLAQSNETDRWAVESILRDDGSSRRVVARTTAIEWGGVPAALILLRPLPEVDDEDFDSILGLMAAANKVFASVSMKLTQTTDGQLDEAIENVLTEIATSAGVDRAYVILLSEDGSTLTCTHEWCAEGIEPQRDYVQELRSADFPWSHGILAANGRIHVGDLAVLPPEADPEKESFGLYDVRSVLQVPMLQQGRLIGILGFNAVHREALWPEAVIDQVAAVADGIATALARREATQAIALAHAAADRTNKLKDRMLSRISHELRTPLSAVLGFSELLSLEETDEQRQALFREVQESGSVLLSLVDDVLDITRLTTGELGLVLEPVLLAPLVAKAIQAASAVADQSGVSVALQQEIPGDLSLTVDSARFLQVVDQLVSNAVLYNKVGGSVTIDYQVDTDEGRVELSISDTGKGMTAEQIERAFEPFDRLGAETTDVPGSGVGLSLARLLVEAMGGTLNISSAPGVGTTATIRF